MLAFAVAMTAAAHAEPVRITPGDGAVLNTAPIQVAIEMSQEMARTAGENDIDVLDYAGNEVTIAAATIDATGRRRMTVPLPADIPPGAYTIRWKTLSAEDGDDANGETSFTFDPSAAPTPGREVLREDLPGSDPSPSPANVPSIASDGDAGVSWILVAAAAAGTFVLGAGGAYLLIQKRP